MKSSLLLWCLSVMAVVLAAANVAVRTEWPAGHKNTRNVEPSSSNSPTSADSAPSGGPAVVSGDENQTEAQAAPAAVMRPGAPPAFNWAAVESTDYKQYAANLRALGFPEELVRAMVIADLEGLYEPRIAPLRPKTVPYDAPVSQRQTRITPEDLDRMRQLREVQMEKQAAIKAALGVWVPREILTTPTSRNYVAYDYALNLLPPEKRDAAQLALEDEWFADDLTKHLDRASYVEAYKGIRGQRNAALTQILTPEEFQRFEMNSTPAGTELARRVIGMEPTDEEFLAMYAIAWDNWVETGGVGGLWRAVRVPPNQIEAADEHMNARLRETLSPDRYVDYQMATSDIGQQLRNFAARYDLSRATLVQAFPLEAEADQIRKAIARSGQLPNPSDPTQLQSRLGELQRQTEQVLGPDLWQAWNDGKGRRVKLEP